MSKNLSFVNEYDLTFHVNEVLHRRRRFENAAQGVSRMIAEAGIEKISRAGRTAYDFKFFRHGSKHPVGWFEEINDFVHFVKDAAEGGSAKENAFVLVGEPGNGKTFFLDYTCAGYRQFLSKPGNRKFTFDFVGLDEALGFDSKVARLQSLTFEDPMILVMNLYEDENKSKEAIASMGFDDKMIDILYSNYRPLGASTEYLWHELLDHLGGDLKKVLEHVQVAPVPIRKSLGITTGKYSAKDKITSSSVDLLGEESLQHIMLLGMGDPNRFDLRRGALARVAGSGVHFADELFKNKKDLTQVYLDVIQNRNIVLDGFIWPIDTLIIATSNNAEYNRFVSEEEEAPIKDRCRICYVGHNTDYILQQELTRYAIGSKRRTTITGEDMHEDPNLNFATSVGAVLTRLITQVTESSKLNVVEMMKLEAGQTAGEKGLQTLAEIKDKANSNRDVTKRWGQKGLGQRSVGRALQILEAMPESNEGKCLFAKDIFSAMERVILDYVAEATDQENFREALEEARKLYRGQIKAAISNAYRDDPDSVRKDVMNYVNMIIVIDSDKMGPDNTLRYKDPQTGDVKSIKIDSKYIDSIEKRMGLNNKEQKEAFRTTIRKIYTQKVTLGSEPNFDFMDNEKLVNAVIEVRLESDVAGQGSLIGALANRQNEECQMIYSKMVKAMLSNELGYCRTCATKTIEYFCEKDDEN